MPLCLGIAYGLVRDEPLMVVIASAIIVVLIASRISLKDIKFLSSDY